MKKSNSGLLVAFLMTFMITLSSCEIIGSIFKAGMLFTVIAIIVIVLIIFWVIRKLRK